MRPSDLATYMAASAGVDDAVDLQLRAMAASHPDADGRVHQDVGRHAHRAPHDELAQLLDQDQRVLGRGLGEDQHEFLAAIAAEDVAGANAPRDETRQLTEHGIAHPVAVRVVDRLEAVDVHEGHRQWLGVARRALDLTDERAEQRFAVRDSGQAIAGGLRLRLGEGAGGTVEGSRQPPLGRNARLLEHDGLTLVDRLLQILRQPLQAEAEIAPRGEGHGRGAHADGQADEADHEAASLHRLVDQHHAQQGQAGSSNSGIQESDQAEKPEQARPPRRNGLREASGLWAIWTMA